MIVDTRMADRVGINPAGAGFTDDLRHSIEHARSGLDVHTRITEKEHVGIGRVDESLNTRGGVVLWIDDVHLPPRRFAPPVLCAMRRVTPCGRTTMTPAIRFALRNSLSCCSTTSALAARRVTHEQAFTVAHDDSSMKHVEILACRHEKHQIAALQMRCEPSHGGLRYTFQVSPLRSESGYNIQHALPADYRDRRH